MIIKRLDHLVLTVRDVTVHSQERGKGRIKRRMKMRADARSPRSSPENEPVPGQ
jgi:hypothetical protein